MNYTSNGSGSGTNFTCGNYVAHQYEGNPNPTYSLIVNIIGSGTVSPGSGSYAAGTPITLTANPSAGWNFSGWSGDITGATINGNTITFTLNSNKNITATFQGPYGGSNWSIPGTIEAENYDIGGEGISYHDIDATNSGNTYRNDGVDITQEDGGNVIGWFKNGEWMEYTVNTEGGLYDITIRTGTNLDYQQKIKVYLDDNLLTTIDVPDNGSWDPMVSTTVNNIFIPGGNNQILKIENVNNDFDLNWIQFTKTNSVPEASGPYIFQPP